ncbi:MAG: CopG family transcriptional regulator [Patescibacteria group bacterium]
MIRTQIYLPEDTHTQLIHLAKQEKTTLSKLIREGATTVIKKRRGNKSMQQKALDFFANPPKKYQVSLPKSAVELVREERDARGY